MMKTLERYHTMWTAHDLIFSLYFDTDGLEKQGFELVDKEGMEIYEERECECGNQRELLPTLKSE